jgi:peptidoglycan/LPS O-acetylase OafA/YrhL
MTFSLIKPSTSHYRADIDGLRAVAVLLVLAYHLGTSRVSGGFVGVDVFFVISGYLIGSIILSEIDRGKFSLISFYERRVRRIVPALFVTLAICAVLAYKFFLPAELDEFAKSFFAATFSFSNIFFYHQAGYFEGAAAMKPLLHTWSLAVEEQFYIFLPLFLLAQALLTPRSPLRRSPSPSALFSQQGTPSRRHATSRTRTWGSCWARCSLRFIPPFRVPYGETSPPPLA